METESMHTIAAMALDVILKSNPHLQAVIILRDKRPSNEMDGALVTNMSHSTYLVRFIAEAAKQAAADSEGVEVRIVDEVDPNLN